jgi:hypothetical protein
MRSLVVLAFIVSTASADDRGATFGASVAGGWGSRGGPALLGSVAIGKRFERTELLFEPRLMENEFHGQEDVAFELGVTLRIFVEPRTAIEVAGGLALLPGTNGDSTPDSQPFVSLGASRVLTRSNEIVLEARVLVDVTLGVQNDNAGKSALFSGLAGLTMRIY